MRERISRLIRAQCGSVAPTVALSLTALIVAGGVAFDYAQMASLDTELQNAADQAALAAASQLDGRTNACARAAAAAANMLTNITLAAWDGTGSRNITIANEPGCDASGNIRFYQNIQKTQAATSDANANFVEVQVNPRSVTFALTPIVGAISSGPMRAMAFAGVGEATCRVPPLMLCNPDEANDPNFTIANYVGKGLRLVANDGGGNYAPGNFGFLDVGQGQGAANLRAALGRQGDPGNCSQGSGVTTEPGNMITLRDALNTRFDMYDNGLNQACGNTNGLCPPSANSRKDLIQDQNGCTFRPNGGNNGWREAANTYPPTVLTTARSLTEPEIDSLKPMGYPRDKCHAVSISGVCAGGRVGDGDWDRYAYFRSHSNPSRTPQNYNILSTSSMNSFLNTTFGTTTPTRHQVYVYEMANSGTRLQAIGLPGNETAHGTPICNPPGVSPGPNVVDRRVLSVAVINCSAESVQGRTPGVGVTKFIDIFLVEPAVQRARTENSDVYVEIIGESAFAAQGNNFQAVKKAVPYLIE